MTPPYMRVSRAHFHPQPTVHLLNPPIGRHTEQHESSNPQNGVKPMPTTIQEIDYASTAPPVMRAYYTASRTTKFVTIGVIVDGRHAVSEIIPVNGKREARRMAARFGATPWNF
jgi:hypothetical protein